ncbi:MAG: hypothetical protein WBN40_06790 [Pseudomonadales bacterium]
MLLWSAQYAGTHYQLRRAGHSLRLYRNGVFHSQYNGARPLNGGVWDMLWIPLCARPPQSLRRVLMLGVGCGAALKKIADYFPAAELTGVDLDALHLWLAKRYLGLGSDACSLHCSDAVTWLQRAGGQRFDVIIDDLFGEGEAGPQRAVALDDKWRRTLQRHLAPAGLLVANCVHSREARALYQQDTAGFPHALGLREAGYENRVVLASKQPLDMAALKRRYAALMAAHWGKRNARLPVTMTLGRLSQPK